MDDFGVCELSDLLSDVPEGHLETTGEGPNLVISLPKKNRTADEISRTKKFGKEVAELLRDCDKYSLPFTAFVPSYHHHFGRQCRLSNYGFSKVNIKGIVHFEHLSTGQIRPKKIRMLVVSHLFDLKVGEQKTDFSQ